MVAPHRSASIDALRRNALTIWPGMTVFWIGDLSHQGSVSGHNPDDYTGVRAEMLDDDTDPEVRALDFMIGPKFTTQDGWDLVNALVKGVDKHRLYYVIYRSTIWRRATGFTAEGYGGDNHNDHVHVSGHVSDDANGADWRSVLALGGGLDMALRDDPDGRALIYRVYGIEKNEDPITYTKVDGTRTSEANLLAQKLAELDVALDEVKAALADLTSAPPGGITEATVRTIVQEEVPPLVRAELDTTRLIG